MFEGMKLSYVKSCPDTPKSPVSSKDFEKYSKFLRFWILTTFLLSLADLSGRLLEALCHKLSSFEANETQVMTMMKIVMIKLMIVMMLMMMMMMIDRADGGAPGVAAVLLLARGPGPHHPLLGRRGAPRHLQEGPLRGEERGERGPGPLPRPLPSRLVSAGPAGGQPQVRDGLVTCPTLTNSRRLWRDVGQFIKLDRVGQVLHSNNWRSDYTFKLFPKTKDFQFVQPQLVQLGIANTISVLYQLESPT